jgi:hypothetical protein
LYILTWNIVQNHDGIDISTEILAVHAALLYTGNNTGKILYFSGSQHDLRNYNFDANRLWDPTTNRIEVIHYPIPASTNIPTGELDIQIEHDLFCCGHAFLEDGSLIEAGGTSKYPSGRSGRRTPLWG